MADRAMELFDDNGDGRLDPDELRNCPGLAAGLEVADQNGDGSLQRAELENRIELYRELGTGLRSQAMRFTYRGRPLVDAEVRLEPEPFLGDAVEPAEGTTGAGGDVRPVTIGAEVPAVRVGYYRVRVTSPSIDLPEKYNASTELGVEFSPVSESGAADTHEFRLE